MTCFFTCPCLGNVLLCAQNSPFFPSEERRSCSPACPGLHSEQQTVAPAGSRRRSAALSSLCNGQGKPGPGAQTRAGGVSWYGHLKERVDAASRKGGHPMGIRGVALLSRCCKRQAGFRTASLPLRPGATQRVVSPIAPHAPRTPQLGHAGPSPGADQG